MIIIALLASLILSIIIVLWLTNLKKSDPLYKQSCNLALKKGLISVLPIMGASAVFTILNHLLNNTVLKDFNILVYEALHDFIVLAFSEELVKFLLFKDLLKKKVNPYTFRDVVAYMIIIGATFGLVEDIIYAFGSDPITMLVRGITIGHAGYGFIMGYFYAKKLLTGKNHYGIIAFLIPFFIHGLYDFSLTPELFELNDNLVFIPITLAFIELVTIFLIIRFFRKTKNKEDYNKPLIQLED